MGRTSWAARALRVTPQGTAARSAAAGSPRQGRRRAGAGCGSPSPCGAGAPQTRLFRQPLLGRFSLSFPFCGLLCLHLRVPGAAQGRPSAARRRARSSRRTDDSVSVRSGPRPRGRAPFPAAAAPVARTMSRRQERRGTSRPARQSAFVSGVVLTSFLRGSRATGSLLRRRA